MAYNYDYTKKIDRQIKTGINKYACMLDSAIINAAIEMAVNAVKTGLQAAARAERKPDSVSCHVDLAIAIAINQARKFPVERALTEGETRCLLSIVQTPYHSSGKIEGMQSIDSNSMCEFCQAMRAINDPRIICKSCYAYKENKFKTAVQARHEITAYILSTFEFAVNDLKQLPLYTPIVRFNSDGDLINAIQAKNYHKIALAFPHIQFGFWFKNTAAMKAAVKEYGKLANIVYIYSDPYINGDTSTSRVLLNNPYIDHVFTVYQDKSYTIAAINAGAAACNGKKCRKCGYKCYYNTHTAFNIAEIARGLKVSK